ncbi:LAME_0C03818g1_1 [Lachancea meyersii CBS 8951]|uniref:LAME_0C03818g1_1 n=1 Tax=Lachancea meyersii CBS 8951 TaxID=1266667 RepID=A0A1G4J134_9SACH|nr:LAME_0C03818g1_1 [Lachancea meyersii CBS 8951]
MEHSADSFEYLFHLSKGLSTECRATRQGTERIELLVRRLAKLTQTSYEDLSKEPSQQVWDEYNKMSTENEKDRLIRENYALVYQIECQEYVCKRIWALIDQIEDLLESIKQFVVEQGAHRARTESQFVEKVVQSRIRAVQKSSRSLTESDKTARTKLDLLIQELQDVCRQINWDQVAQTVETRHLEAKILQAQDKYGIKLINN